MRLWALLLLATAVASGTARAAAAEAPYALLSGYTMTSWTATDGSSIGPVYALAQDRDGYLWIGTTGGVVRFDGARFTRWDALHMAALPHADVRALSLARDGTLWVGSDRLAGAVTVTALRGGSAVTVAKGSPPHDAVTSLLEDHGGTVWAVSGGVLYRLRDGAWDSCATGAMAHAAVVSVREDARGALWAATRQGVFRTSDGESFELVAEGIARETSESADGTLWMTDPSHGVRRRGAPTPAIGMDGWGNRLLHDSRGNLWVATTGQGLWRLRAGAASSAPLIELATNQTGLSSNAVQTLLEDRDGNIWVGTMLGLHSLTPQQLTPLAPGTVVRTVLPVLRAIDPRLREVAATLGASPFRVLGTVDLSLALRSFGLAVGFAFAASLGEFGATSFLARPDRPTLPVVIFGLDAALVAFALFRSSQRRAS